MKEPAPESLAHNPLLERDRASAPGWSLHTIPQLPHIDLQLINCTAEGIAVHAQLAGGAALVSFVFLENSEDEPLLELPHALRVEDVAPVHLQDECFQLIFHDMRLFL